MNSQMIHFCALVFISVIAAFVFVLRRTKNVNDCNVSSNDIGHLISMQNKRNSLDSIADENLYHRRFNSVNPHSTPYDFHLKLDDDIQVFKDELVALLNTKRPPNKEFNELIPDETISRLPAVSNHEDFKLIVEHLISDAGIAIPQSFVFGNPWHPTCRGIVFDSSDKKYHLLALEREGVIDLCSLDSIRQALYVSIRYLSLTNVSKSDFEYLNSNMRNLLRWAERVRNMSLVNRNFGKQAYSLFCSDFSVLLQIYSIRLREITQASEANVCNAILEFAGIPESVISKITNANERT